MNIMNKRRINPVFFFVTSCHFSLVFCHFLSLLISILSLLVTSCHFLSLVSLDINTSIVIYVTLYRKRKTIGCY